MEVEGRASVCFTSWKSLKTRLWFGRGGYSVLGMFQFMAWGIRRLFGGAKTEVVRHPVIVSFPPHPLWTPKNTLSLLWGCGRRRICGRVLVRRVALPVGSSEKPQLLCLCSSLVFTLDPQPRLSVASASSATSLFMWWQILSRFLNSSFHKIGF